MRQCGRDPYRGVSYQILQPPMHHRASQESFVPFEQVGPDQHSLQNEQSFPEHKRYFDLVYVILNLTEASLTSENSGDTGWCMRVVCTVLQQQ